MASLEEAVRKLLEAVPEPLAEPAYALLAALAGLKHPSEAPEGVASLCSPDGTCIGSRDGRGLAAWLPIAPLPREYSSPAQVTASLLRDAVKRLAGSAKPPLVVDYTARRRGFQCRPRLGCRPLPQRGTRHGTGEELQPPGYRPRLCVPAALYPRCIRVARRRLLRVEWLTLSTPSRCLLVLCTGSSCVFEATPDKLAIIEGSVAAAEAPVCSPHRVYLDSVAETAYEGLNPETVKPSLWIMGAAAPLWAEKAGNAARILLWNPMPRAQLATLLLRGARVKKAEAASPLRPSEPLAPEIDRVRVPLPPLGAVVVSMETRPLPPLLRR